MQQTEIVTFIVIVNLLLLIFVVGIILFVLQYRKRKLDHTNETMAMKTKHNQEILSTQLEIQAQTMQHIGREIHDNVGQKLTLASLYTQQLAYENKAPQINDKIEGIGKIINESLQELRQLSKSLTDDTIANNTLSELIQEECNKMKALNKCKIIFFDNSRTNNLPYQTKSILLRVVQEFFQNSMKHANCKNITASLSKNDLELTLKIEDDGIGFDTFSKNHSGIGLKNMQKRVQLLNGIYELTSAIDNGTKLSIKVPL
jgi:signal transduction histidine kinase